MAAIDDTTTDRLAHPRRDAHRRRRHPWRWVIGIVIVAVILAALWFIGEAVARGLVQDDIRRRVVAALSLPADSDVDVTVAGAVIPQLISGSLQDVVVTAEGVPVGSATGRVDLQATGVPVRGDGPLSSADAQVALTGDQLGALLPASAGSDLQDVSLAAPGITATLSIPVDGTTVPAVATFLPSVSEGDLVLTPQSYLIDGVTLSASDLQARFGAAADDLVADRTVCVKKDVPAGMTLSEVTVDGDTVLARFTVDGGILTDAAMQRKGTCS